MRLSNQTAFTNHENRRNTVNAHNFMHKRILLQFRSANTMVTYPQLDNIGQVYTRTKEGNHLDDVCQSSLIRTEKKTKPVERKTRQQTSIYIMFTKVMPQITKAAMIASKAFIHPTFKKQYNTSSCVPAKKTEAAMLVEFQIDTGASCSILTLQDYKKITDKQPDRINATFKLCDHSVTNPIGITLLQSKRCKEKSSL